jgi:hypothetical protein
MLNHIISFDFTPNKPAFQKEFFPLTLPQADYTFDVIMLLPKQIAILSYIFTRKHSTIQQITSDNEVSPNHES